MQSENKVSVLSQTKKRSKDTLKHFMHVRVYLCSCIYVCIYIFGMLYINIICIYGSPFHLEHFCVIVAGLLVSRGCWPWLSPLRGWGSLTMAFTGNVAYNLRAMLYICNFTMYKDIQI